MTTPLPGLLRAEDMAQVADRIKNDPEVREQLRRVVESLNDPEGVISAFQSFASER